MAKLKVIHVIAGLNQGGAETMLYKLVFKMDNSRFQNVVISMTDAGIFGDKIVRLGVPLYCLELKKNPLSARKAIFLYKRLLKNLNPDVVQGWMYHANLFALLAKIFRSQVKILFNIRHSLSDLQNEKRLTRLVIRCNAWASRLADKVINNSLVSINQHHAIGFSKKNSVYIGNGFEINKFCPSSEKYNDFRRKLGFNSEIKLVGLIARFHPVKNHMGFLKVAHVLVNQMHVANCYFVLGGRDCDSSNQILVEQIKSLGLENKVVLLGPVKSDDILPALDVYLSMSLGEGFPNVIGEAMTCGVPCIATEVGDCRAIIGNGNQIFKVTEEEKIAYRIKEILNLSENEYVSLSKSCRARVKQNYQLETIVKKYEDLYLSLMKGE